MTPMLFVATVQSCFLFPFFFFFFFFIDKIQVLNDL
jgi:hypothetical protein